MKITVYTVTDCQFSQKEKEYLKAHNLAFEEKNLEHNKDWLAEMLTVGSNFAGTPVTKIEKDDGKNIVLKGFTEAEVAEALGLKTQAASQVTVQNQQSSPTPTQPPASQQPDTSTPTPTQPPAGEQPPQPTPPTPQPPNTEPLPPMPTVIEPPAEAPQTPPAQSPPQPTSTVQPPANDPQLNSILNNLQSMANTPSAQPQPPSQPNQSQPATPQNLPNIPNPNF